MQQRPALRTMADNNLEADTRMGEGGQAQFRSLGRPSQSHAQQQPLFYPPPVQNQFAMASKRRQVQPAGNQRDLIIRMLAEIFQVKMDAAGHMRWQQVSTSLVPISLYSRTTSKWLDYLLSVPPANPIEPNDPANAMSPDSRDFLLLLQQFHQQMRTTNLQQNQLATLEGNEAIVFQVIGHDFVQGQCRKILNVKLRQPGTRLGQASDYFVYWREQTTSSRSRQRLSHQQFSASSYASNASSCIQQQQQSAPLKPNQTQNMLNPSNVTMHNSDRYPQQQFQTWGLNFASMNDAKLFFDICSLNVVNLDFNSEYLNQLPLVDGRNQLAGRMSPCSVRAQMSQHRARQQAVRNAAILHQQQQQQQARMMVKNRATSRQPKRGMEMSCSSCRQPKLVQEESKQCPVHGQSGSGQQRARSKSTTRQPNGDSYEGRARSLSMPASPESSQFMQRQTEADERELDRPEKPARGHLRNEDSITGNGRHQSECRPPPPVRDSSDTRLLHSRPSSKTRYMGYLHQNQLEAPASKLRQEEAANRLLMMRMQRDHETLDAQRNARVARAQWAKSRDMKEFLSLDAGGQQQFQPPIELKRLGQQQRPKRPAKSTQETDCLRTNSTRLAMDTNAKVPPNSDGDQKQTGSNPVAMSRIDLSSGGIHNSVQCNAATTTDDLPMDSSTRRRMLRLTSDEIISERTEPKSISTIEPMQTNIESVEQQRQQQSSRALSLGPDGDSNFRGRRARSDAGRRRSLERSGCVDLDSVLPASSFMKQTPRLSPLPQSLAASPQQQNELQLEMPSEADRKLYGTPGDLMAPQIRASLADQIHNELASFKSVPDMSRIDFGRPEQLDWPMENECDDEHSRRFDFAYRSRVGHSNARPNLSSYAVPLCATVKRRPEAQHQVQRRQCHSCPNSLRRKRAPPALSGAQVHQLVDCCPCLHCQQMAFVSPMNLCACCRPADWPDCGQHSRRLIQKQHAGCQCQAAARDEDQPRRHQTSRPQSSQSVRSPLQYGLYESDEEDEDDNGGDFSSPAVRPVQGYDQTMLRACLKSRRRSKSQPPGGLDVDADEEEEARNEPTERSAGQHLTKSMENVEKLIREVQNELRQLTRQPLGAARIDLKTSAGMESASASGIKTDQQKHQQQPQEQHYDAKMSLEEKEAEARRKLQADQTRKWQPSYSSATRRAGQFKCVGAIRKAGFLSVKKWILKRRQSIELARKQGWKRYWVCLRGTALLFHSVIDHSDGDLQQQPDGSGHPKRIDLATWIKSNCSSQQKLKMAGGDEKSRGSFLDDMTKCFIEEEPRHLIIIDGAIAQPIPEHPKRDFVFCLSTTFGDAYLFQAGCQLESDNWIAAIHNACAASIARDLVRDEAIKLFEQKIRHFELDAEKKLFLRHRLESRLTSMSSMCKSTGPLDSGSKRPNSMRSLMFQLSQQLLALDTYIEQLHCEVYQLRCYLSSCSAQNLFYHNLATTNTVAAASLAARRHDLPHPKSLLMHVSKPTKVLLIKMGVFTVSSFHALIHARQDSARSILQSIEQHSSCPESPLLELRLKSRSISETLNLTAGTSPEERQLAAATENLIELANFKTIPIELNRELFNKITGQIEQLDLPSDDRYSIQDFGHSLRLNWRLNSKLTSLAIIKQLLKMLRQENGPELDYLNYYLRLVVQQRREGNSQSDGCEYYVVKQRETPEDWTNFAHLELLEKVVFRVELNRSQVDEDETTAPFGISVEGQLMSDTSESALNVFCSYVEWGSVADKAGLGDEDELLMINGIPVADLDLMFVECILQDSNKLRAVVRSSRLKCPPSSKRLDRTSWRSMDEDEDDGGKDGNSGGHQNRDEQERRAGSDGAFNSHQLMSDEYLTSLVCPPPPTKSSAVLRHEAANLLRRKSDLDLDQTQVDHEMNGEDLIRVTKARSEHQMDIQDEMAPIDSGDATLRTSAELANLLVQKSERISRLFEVDDRTRVECHDSPAQRSLHDQNQVERLKKSILELIETEYAYVRHLETINEHYMSPLSEMQFLNIFDLSSFNQSVINLLRFQSSFFSLLINDIYKQLELADQAKGQVLSDDFERFNSIVQRVDSINSEDEFEPILSSIAVTFTGEAAGFKVYAPYCVAYSRLQRVLHPKSTATNYHNLATITSIPTAINVFASSSTSSNNSNDQHLRLLSLAGCSNANGAEERSNQLRQLSEFLNNLDSSSSSVSFSLQQQNTSKQDHSKASSLTNSIELNSSSGNKAACRKGGQQQHHHQNFESYLIKPIQRIVKYPMLLNSIILAAETQPEAKNSNPTESELRAAIRQLELIVNHVNESQRVHDEFGDVFDHIERQFFELQARETPRSCSSSLFGPHQPQISLNIGQLLHTSPVEWLNMEAFSSKSIGKRANLSSVLFVFESCVVFICKELVKPSSKRLRLAPKTSEPEQSGGIAARMLHWSTGSASSTNNAEQISEIVRYQTLIPVSEVQVRSVSNETEQERGQAGARFKWELFQCSSSNSNSSLLAKNSQCSGRARKQQIQHRNSNSGKVYLLASSTSEERNSFLRKIRLTIRESVRNMSLPAVTSNKSSFSNKSIANNNKKLSTSSTSSRTSNTNVNTSMSFSPADLITQDQSTTIKFEPYKTKQAHGIET